MGDWNLIMLHDWSVFRNLIELFDKRKYENVYN